MKCSTNIYKNEKKGALSSFSTKTQKLGTKIEIKNNYIRNQNQ
ncbi:hypothetical protein SynRS9907_01607 [Synechococcus sp. RS9907]|nr:hypothetical protein SynRS9907_01607 [Synechococcus sp. RS9907]